MFKNIAKSSFFLWNLEINLRGGINFLNLKLIMFGLIYNWQCKNNYWVGLDVFLIQESIIEKRFHFCFCNFHFHGSFIVLFWVCITMDICAYIYTFIWVCIFIYNYIYTYICMYVYLWICSLLYIFVYVCVHIFLYVYSWIYLWTYVHTHIFIHICIYIYM